jgi:uncharacterized membrane protein
MGPVANAERLAAGIPGAELHVVPDGGHAVPLEHPTASAQLLIEWVRRHATVQPPAPRSLDLIGEPITRSFSLTAGTLRNARDAGRPGRGKVDADALGGDDSAMTTPASTDHTQITGHPPPPGPLQRWVLPIRPPKPVNPVLVKHAEQRAEYVQNRMADAITAFAGSMTFVYLHILWFSCWIGFGVEHYPFGLLTMIVSLEAIFLSTFVLISQNRADAKRQVIADQQWKTVQEEDEQNKQLLELSQQILALTKEVRGFAGLAQEDHEQNAQLLDLSRRTLALTTEVHHAAGAGGRGSRGSERTAEDCKEDDG